MAKTAMKIKQQRKPKFSTREFEKIWNLPCLLPRTGLQGTDPRRKES